jgi:hypothetical protein
VKIRRRKSKEKRAQEVRDLLDKKIERQCELEEVLRGIPVKTTPEVRTRFDQSTGEYTVKMWTPDWEGVSLEERQRVVWGHLRTALPDYDSLIRFLFTYPF